MDTYRIKIEDLEYPGEFADLSKTQAFADGARFVLDNMEPRNANYPPEYKVTITTYANVYDYDTNSDVTTEVNTREV